MVVNHLHTSSFPEYSSASRILTQWSQYGSDAAWSQLMREYRTGHDGLLLAEVHKRLVNDISPFLLIDGLWLEKESFGGISRVWKQIIATFLLPGMISPRSSIGFIDRNRLFSAPVPFSLFPAPYVDPHDLNQVLESSNSFSSLFGSSLPDVFCSTWISTTGQDNPICAEVALVHDCLPEHFLPTDSALTPLRYRWISGASSYLCVSRSTALDLIRFYSCSQHSLSWCHLAPANSFSDPTTFFNTSIDWASIFLSDNICPQFILLPGSASIGSYKNPEFLARVLLDPSLIHIKLLISGYNSELIRDSLISLFPALNGRIFSAGFTDIELAVVYRNALAVVIPSLIEGFGLPAIEVMAAGGIPFVSDAPGLSESGGGAALRFDPFDESQLISLLCLLIDPSSSDWIRQKILIRSRIRLKSLNPHLLGLSLLAQSRVAYKSCL